MVFRDNGSEKVPLSRAVLWITLSVILVSGGISFFWFLYLNFHEGKKSDPTYQLQTLVLEGEGEIDPAVFLALIGEPKSANLYRLNTKEIKKRIGSFPLFKSVDVERVFPSTLFIRYETRTPVYSIGELSSGSVDPLGTIFPHSPFLTPKKIPQVYFGGLPPNPWGGKADPEKLALVASLLGALNEPLHRVKMVDLSRIDAPSYGGREILLLVEETAAVHDQVVVAKRLLRLPAEGYQKALENYARLRAQYPVEPGMKTIDLRIHSLAFIEEKND